MEAEPHAGNWAIRMTPAERRSLRRRIIAGGKIADKLQQMADSQHEIQEVPEAEKVMKQKLGLLEQSRMKPDSDQKTEISQKIENASFWQKGVAFLRRLLIP